MARKKRIKRHHLKRFSQAYINIGPTLVRRSDRPLYGCTTGYIQITDSYLVELFGLDKSEVHNDPYLAVQRLRKMLEEEIKPDFQVCLTNKKYCRIMMLWTREYSRFYFIKNVGSLFFRSISYGSREEAMKYYQHGNVTWIERSDSPPQPPSPSAV